MIRIDIDTRYALAAAGQLHSRRLPCPTGTREHRTGRRQERSHQGKPMNASWPNTKTRLLFQVPERGCCQRQRPTPLDAPACGTGRRPRPKVCASLRVSLPQGPVVGGTLRRAAVEALCAPGEQWGPARGDRTRCPAGTPVHTTAAEQAARITGASTKADAFEGVV